MTGIIVVRLVQNMVHTAAIRKTFANNINSIWGGDLKVRNCPISKQKQTTPNWANELLTYLYLFVQKPLKLSEAKMSPYKNTQIVSTFWPLHSAASFINWHEFQNTEVHKTVIFHNTVSFLKSKFYNKSSLKLVTINGMISGKRLYDSMDSRQPFSVPSTGGNCVNYDSHAWHHPTAVSRSRMVKNRRYFSGFADDAPIAVNNMWCGICLCQL